MSPKHDVFVAYHAVIIVDVADVVDAAVDADAVAADVVAFAVFVDRS